MIKTFLSLLLFFAGFHFSGNSQVTSDQLMLNDSIWRFTHSDTLQLTDGFLINYYDSLALHFDFREACYVGQDALNAEKGFTRKQRILPNGFSYALDY